MSSFYDSEELVEMTNDYIHRIRRKRGALNNEVGGDAGQYDF